MGFNVLQKAWKGEERASQWWNAAGERDWGDSKVRKNTEIYSLCVNRMFLNNLFDCSNGYAAIV
jgi:hypothetical protein